MQFLGKSGGLGTTSTALALLGALANGCGQTAGSPKARPGDGAAGSGGDATSLTAGKGGGGNGGQAAAPCEGAEVAVSKRLVRLSFSQVLKAVGALTDAAQVDALARTYEIVDPRQRAFPPLASPREGAAFTPATWATSDHIAADVGSYALEHLVDFSGCGASPTEACVRAFLPRFAERAFRHPLGSDDEASLLQVVSEVLALGDTPAEALRYGVYAVLESPQFLYRTELGVEPKAAGALTSHEMASQLSFFLTDGPPDQPLLDAAEADALLEPTDIAAQVERLLQTTDAQRNLEDALFSYFGLPNLLTVVVDDVALTNDVREAMYRESTQFLTSTLWSGPFAELLTARRSTIDASLAPLYGFEAFPPPGATLDADGFALVDLPEARAGLLTQLGFLTSRARPDSASVVGRGLLVNSAILCGQNPPFPESLGSELISNVPNLTSASEREKAQYRAETNPCQGCHTLFDAYGLALENFDLMGRYITMDELGRPIDAAVILPPLGGGQAVSSAAEMARELAASPAFRSCMTKSMLVYALADFASEATLTSINRDGCANRATADELAQSATFSELLTRIATSSTLRLRAADVGAP
jgi:hypothetical protein